MSGRYGDNLVAGLALDAVRSGRKEPFARRILREAADPQARFFEVVVEAAVSR